MTWQPEPRTQCGRKCKHWRHDMEASYCGHPKAMEKSSVGYDEMAMSREGLCFHGNDREPARDELFEPFDPVEPATENPKDQIEARASALQHAANAKITELCEGQSHLRWEYLAKKAIAETLYSMERETADAWEYQMLQALGEPPKIVITAFNR